jgi:tetratricopeptide (TPR) repeat protein
MKPTKKKVIRINFSANFFYDRAMQSMDRYNYDKALKYFQRVLEYEPNNITNHWNVAGILSEMGKFDESNRILQSTLNDFQEGQTESYFYLANNYANMDLWDEAELQLVHYLENDPDGFYLQEAEEMLDYLSEEFNRSPKLAMVKSRAQYFEHDQARELLEQGKLPEAIELLKVIIERYPDFTAARNNLGLAYFYSGMNEPSLQAILEVLALEPSNIHALCNMAIVLHHVGAEEQLKPLRQQLITTIPFSDEHLFKLATTLGFLNEHEAAYRHFSRLRRLAIHGVEPSLLHFLAVASYNIGKYEYAQQLWKQVVKMDEEAELARYYLEKVTEWKQSNLGQIPRVKLHYHYQLPPETKQSEE